MIGPFDPGRGAAAFPMVAGRGESATGAASITNTTVTANPITCQLKNAARQINPIRTPRAMSAESLPTAPDRRIYAHAVTFGRSRFVRARPSDPLSS